MPSGTFTKQDLRPARSTLLLSLASRIPVGALSLLIILAVRETGHSYSLAGLTSGACAAGVTISAPLIGRLADRCGQTPVLLGSSGATAVTMIAFGLLPRSAPGILLPLIALLCGLALPPISSSVRVVWRSILTRSAFDRILTLDATLQELAFLLGPILMLGLAARTSAHTVLAVTGVAWALLTVVIASLTETRLIKGTPAKAGASWLGPLRLHAMRTHALVAITLGWCIGATEFGVITLVQGRGHQAWLSVIYGAWSIASALGGLIAMRFAAPDPDRRLGLLLVVGAVTTAVLSLAVGPLSLGILLPFAGACFAPLFGLQNAALASSVPSAMLTEAFGVYSAALTLGIALGSSAAGLLVSHSSYRVAFLTAALALAVGAVTLRARSNKGPTGA